MLAWEGIGDACGIAIDPDPEAIDALHNIWPNFETFDLTNVSECLPLKQKDFLRSRRVVRRRGRLLLRGLRTLRIQRASRPGLPGATEPAVQHNAGR